MRAALRASRKRRGHDGPIDAAGWWLAIACALSSLACSTSSGPPPIAPEEARVTPIATTPQAPAATATSSSTPAASESPASAATTPDAGPGEPQPLRRHPGGLVDVQASAPPPPIGEPCSAGAPSCGKAGRIAVVKQIIQMRNVDRPCNGPQTSSPNDMMNVSHACVSGDRVVVWRTCMVCRIPTEDRLVGLVAEMTPEQLADAQKLAGLPPRPLLTSTAAWNHAIADASRRSQVR